MSANGLWDELVGGLGSIPDLSGARCRGRWELFDATIREGRDASVNDLQYARAAAVGICNQCPALAACRAWLHSLPAEDRPLGITAGEVVASDRRDARAKERNCTRGVSA